MPNSPSAFEAADQALFCSRCGRAVMVVGARFCKECGAPLGAPVRWRSGLRWNPWLAVAFSMVPGAGQLYKGQPWRAAGWFALVFMSYLSAPALGFLLHVVCAANAAWAQAAAPHSAPPSWAAARR